MILFDHSQILRHLIGVEHQNQITAAVALIVAQQVHQHMPRRVQTVAPNPLQLVPGENDIIAVDQHKLLRRFHPCQQFFFVLRAKRHHGKHIAPLDLPICPLEDRQQLLFQLRRAAGCNRTDNPLRLFRLLLRREIQQRQMRHPVDLVPLDLKARAVAAKDGARWMQKIPLGVVADSFDNLVLLRARAVARRLIRDFALPSGIRRDLRRISAQQPDRSCACENGSLPRQLRRGKLGVHPLEIRHRPPEHARRQLQPERVPRLQQHRLCLAQSLPHRAVGRLPEITALRVLQMRLAGNQRDAKIGHGASGQDARLHRLLQMREDEPLPAARQHIFAAHRVEHNAASRLARL